MADQQIAWKKDKILYPILQHVAPFLKKKKKQTNKQTNKNKNKLLHLFFTFLDKKIIM